MKVQIKIVASLVLCSVFCGLMAGCVTAPDKNTVSDKYKVKTVNSKAKVGKRVGVGEGGLTCTIGGSRQKYLSHRYYNERLKRLAIIRKENNIAIDSQVHEIEKDNGSNQLCGNKNITEGRARTAFRIVVAQQFSTGSAKLTSKAIKLFKDIIKLYKMDGIRRVLIVGYTDSKGKSGYNQKLSERRARAIAQLFVQEGYPADGVYYKGMGEAEAKADNRTREGRKKNRRIEIIDALTEKGIGSKGARQASHKSKMQNIGQKKKISRKGRFVGGVTSKIPFSGKYYTGQQLMKNGSRYEEISYLNEAGSKAQKIINKKLNDWGWKSSLNGFTIKSNRIPLITKDKMILSPEIPDKKFSTDDYMIYRGVVISTVRSSIGIDLYLHPISILKEKGLLSSSSTLFVYKNKKKVAEIMGRSVLYANDKNMLYRWKAQHDDMKKYGVYGVDVLLSKFSKVDSGKIKKVVVQYYYFKKGRIYISTLKASIAVPKVRRHMSAKETFEHAVNPTTGS